MALIVLHAGMGKAGSSSVQRWLQTSASSLQERGFTVLAAPEEHLGRISFVPCGRHSIHSGWIASKLTQQPPAGREAVETFVEALDDAAQRYGDVILSSEFYQGIFYSPHEETLAGLQRLSDRHKVRVAYYVRPQHESIEAGWRQAGFRSGKSPSAFVGLVARRLHYARTRDGVRLLAPDLDFEPVPFRSDLLIGGDVVADFAHRFLGIEVDERLWVNRGLPLEVVNVLRAAPPGMFWDRSYGNRRVKLIKQLLDGHSFPEDDRIALSRQVLLKYAHHRFAAEHAELGWNDFVPAPEDPAAIPGLEALDELWKPQASPAELSLMFRALQAAIEEP